MTRRQLVVLVVAYLGWVFDLMDVYLMVLVRERAMTELLGPAATPQSVALWGGTSPETAKLSARVPCMLLLAVKNSW